MGSLRIQNRSNRPICLEKKKIGSPAYDGGGIGFNCFDFCCDLDVVCEPKWVGARSALEVDYQEDDFIVLAPGEVFISSWFSFVEMYSFEGKNVSLVQYSAFHELNRLGGKDNMLYPVRSEWVSFPKDSLNFSF